MPLKLLLQLSSRNLFRHKRRNVMLLLAICVAVAGEVLTNSLIRVIPARSVDGRPVAVGLLAERLRTLMESF